MKAVLYDGAGSVRIGDVPKPEICFFGSRTGNALTILLSPDR
jgi:hypothetical protein